MAVCVSVCVCVCVCVCVARARARMPTKRLALKDSLCRQRAGSFEAWINGVGRHIFLYKKLGIWSRRPGIQFWLCHSWMLCTCHHIAPPLSVLCKLGLCVSQKGHNSISSPTFSSRNLIILIKRWSLCPLPLSLGRSL